ncbi:MAG: Na+/H+ antiporter NhaA, partial [Actinobacteria bacterium]|nr:Na+/H+ antiporter NhaA [Actinomycetota bacterium]
AAAALRLAPLPSGMRRAHLLAAGALTGLGFTVPLVVAGVAFPAGSTLEIAKIALLAGSLIAGAAGVLLLRRIPSTPVRTVALVDDLMDRSRLRAALPEVAFVRTPTECEGADVVLIDLARHVDDVAAVRAIAPDARIVGFGPHVDEAAASRARSSGADDVLARSRFFHDPAAALTR